MIGRVFQFAVVMLSLLTGVASAQPGASAPVEVVLRPVVVAGAAVHVDVSLRFRGEMDGETVLRIPDAWGGEENLARAIKDLRVESGVMRPGAQPQFRLVRHRPGAMVTVRYRLENDSFPARDAVRDEVYRVRINKALVHLIGDAAFVTPAFDSETPVHVVFESVPQDWSVASDLQHPGLTLHGLIESITLMGEVDLLTPTTKGKGVRVAMARGEWAVDKQALADMVGAILQAQRDYWGAGDEPFLVTMLGFAPPSPDWLSIGGTGRSDAFAFFTTTNARAENMTRILAHEGMHTWIPRRLGTMRADAREPEDYWFSEGFTDFLTDRVLLRAGLWQPEDFAKSLNEVSLAYAMSPVRGAPNSVIVEKFWTDDAVQKLPYQRGRMVALVLDHAVRTASGGAADLDDVLLKMQTDAAAEGLPVREALLAALMGFGVEGAALLERLIDAGEPILLPADVFGPCGALETIETRPFHRGFDIEATQANGNVITGVVVGGPAAAAGLRDGMRLIRREAGQIGDPTQDIAYVVMDGTTERVVRYRPVGAGATITVQKLLTSEALASPACAARLAGHS